MVDEKWFENGFCGRDNVVRKVGLIHELAYVVHGAYFHHVGCLGEGFAELRPHYLMNLDSKNSRHRKAVANLQEDEMQTIAFINKKWDVCGRKPQRY